VQGFWNEPLHPFGLSNTVISLPQVSIIVPQLSNPLFGICPKPEFKNKLKTKLKLKLILFSFFITSL